MKFRTKKEMVSYFKNMLAVDVRWAVRGLNVIYSYQTIAEKASGEVTHHNGQGFSQFDSAILTSFVNHIRKNGNLTSKQSTTLLRIMPKYAGQLLNHSLAIGKIVKRDGLYQAA